MPYPYGYQSWPISYIGTIQVNNFSFSFHFRREISLERFFLCFLLPKSTVFCTQRPLSEEEDEQIQDEPFVARQFSSSSDDAMVSCSYGSRWLQDFWRTVKEDGRNIRNSSGNTQEKSYKLSDILQPSTKNRVALSINGAFLSQLTNWGQHQFLEQRLLSGLIEISSFS